MSLKHYLSSTLNQKKKGNKRRIGKACHTLAICGLKGKVLSYDGRQPAQPACKGAPSIRSWLPLRTKGAEFVEGNGGGLAEPWCHLGLVCVSLPSQAFVRASSQVATKE